MNPATTRLLIGIAVTAAASYYFDASNGKRRRTMLVDKLKSTGSQVNEKTRAAGHSVSARAQKMSEQAKAAYSRYQGTDDAVARRVRTAVRNATSRPIALGVVAHEGQIILHGEVAPHEHEQVVRAVQGISGVVNVTDHLIERGGIEEPHAPRGFDLKQEHWSPAARALLGTMGSALVAAGIRRRSPLAVLGAVMAGPLLLRSLTNKPLKRLGRRHGVIDVHKTLVVKAPVDRVFALLDDYENFPAFMRNVRKVIRHPDGTSHWVVAGPAETAIEWDSVTTVRQPNALLGWHSVPGSRIEHSGLIRFEDAGEGQTRLNISMSYSPPAGMLGHAVAKLCGADPDTELDEDLSRLRRFVETWKSTAETGRPPRDARRESGADGPMTFDRKRHAAHMPSQENGSRVIAS